MGVKVDFIWPLWVQIYPQFACLTEAQIVNGVLPIAALYCRNDGGGPVSKAETQTALLGLMVAHVTQLLYGANGQQPSPLVGRINTATEGSVTVGTDFPLTQNNAWYMQTPFGAAFFAATAAYRTARYIPGPRRNFNPWLVPR